jgi:hypothetical protein
MRPSQLSTLRLFLGLGLTALWVLAPLAGAAESGDPAPARFPSFQGETWVIRTTDLVSGHSSVDTARISYIGHANPALYVVTRTGAGSKTVIRLNGNGLLPIRYELLGGDGGVERRIDFSDQLLRIAIKGEAEPRIVETAGNTHNSATLLHYLRVFAGQRHSDRVEMKLLVGRSQDAFRIVDVYAKRVAEEDLTVPAGRFRCIKLEFGVAGIIGRLFWRTRYQYYYTAEPPHHFVKYVDPGRECIELITYECTGQASASTDDGDSN